MTLYHKDGNLKKSVIHLVVVSMLGSNLLMFSEKGAFAATPEPPLRSAAPIVLPDMGDAATSNMSNIDENRLGMQIMREIRKDPDYSRDLILSDYYNQLGRELVAAAKRQKLTSSDTGPLAPKFEFFGIRDPSINAFALPGGYIGIHSGLVLAAETESEFASVIGHEIGHITQKHIARSTGQGGTNTLIILGSILLAALAARNSPSVAQGLAIGGQAMAIQNQLSYSRDAEREADRVGFQILQAGGYDVNGTASFFQRLQRATGIMESGVPAYVRTHPLNIERISDMQDRARSVPVRKVQSSTDFHLMQARARLEQQGKFADALETRQYFESLVQQTSVPTKVLQGYYGLSILALKQGKLDDADAYLKKTRDSLALMPSGSSKNVIALDVTAAEIALARKKFDLASTLSQATLKAQPQSKAAGVVWVESQFGAGKFNEPIPWLKGKVKQQKDDADWWDLLARGYALQNKRTLHHAALAEKFAIQGALPAAIEQLRIARQEGDGDFYQLSEVDARSRQFQAQYREELKDAGKIPQK